MCRHAALPGPMQALACKRPAPPPAASRSCWPFTTAGSLQASCWKPAGSLQAYCMQVITAGLCAPAECCACRRCGTLPPHAACAAPAPLHSKALRRVQSAAVEAGSDKDAAASATCSVYSTWQGGGRKHLHYEGGARVKALGPGRCKHCSRRRRASCFQASTTTARPCACGGAAAIKCGSLKVKIGGQAAAVQQTHAPAGKRRSRSRTRRSPWAGAACRCAA